MPKLEPGDSPSIRRRSSRPKKLINNSLLNDLPADVVSSMGDDKEDKKMPPGFNPSDDSEDDFSPSKVSKKNKRTDESEKDSEEEERKNAKKRRRGPGRKSSSIGNNRSSLSRDSTVSKPAPVALATTPGIAPKVKTEPGQEGDFMTCVFCKELVAISNNSRFHYSLHYYQENAFIKTLEPQDLKNGKAQDEVGKVCKYTCPYDGCTRRKMGYKEMCIHLSTAHQILRKFMAEDRRPGMKEALDKLYPPEDHFLPPVQVKQEKGVAPSIVPTRRASNLESDNSEDVDDPSNEPEAASKPVSHKVVVPLAANSGQIKYQGRIKTEVKVETKYMPRPRADKMHNCVICNGNGRHDKEGRNHNIGSGLHDLKYHYAACVYDEGDLMAYVDHGQGKNKKLDELEAFGSKYKYRCPFENCAKNHGMGRNKTIGYKEYAIHCAVWHHQLEKWMKNQLVSRPELKEVYDAMVAEREGDGLDLEDMPDVKLEEMHTCLVCRGEDKDGRNLSFEGTKLFTLRYHYAACFYEEGAYFDKYPPGEKNTNEQGKPIDELGKEMKYCCEERGCTVKRKMGYKEFAIHMSNEHGGLEEVIKKHTNSDIRALSEKIKKKYNH